MPEDYEQALQEALVKIRELSFNRQSSAPTEKLLMNSIACSLVAIVYLLKDIADSQREIAGLE